jgi:hypothetical protein
MSESAGKPGASARRIVSNKQKLASLLDRLSNTFAHTAQLAEQHADRIAQRDDPMEQVERERTRRAREATERARGLANQLREGSAGGQITARRSRPPHSTE